VKLPADSLDHYLNTWPVARLATINSDGTPHQVPLVFVYHDNRIWSPVDGKQKSPGVLKRIQNAEKNPKASLLLDHYDDDWQRLWWIRLEVELQVIRQNENQNDQKDAQQAALALERKYPQYQTTPVLQKPFTMLTMTILKTSNWCNSNT
jgi:PPOX class probable F420-dependent enzyme